jgi:hypothetical protein
MQQTRQQAHVPSSMGSSEFNFRMIQNLALVEMQKLGTPEENIFSLTLTAGYRVSNTLTLPDVCCYPFQSLLAPGPTMSAMTQKPAQSSISGRPVIFKISWTAVFLSKIDSMQPLMHCTHSYAGAAGTAHLHSTVPVHECAFTIIHRALHATVVSALVQPGCRATLVAPHWYCEKLH